MYMTHNGTNFSDATMPLRKAPSAENIDTPPSLSLPDGHDENAANPHPSLRTSRSNTMPATPGGTAYDGHSYRDALNDRHHEDLSPSTSISSFSNYFRRANSTVPQGSGPSPTGQKSHSSKPSSKASFASLHSSTSSHNLHLRPSFGLSPFNRLKNSVLHPHRHRANSKKTNDSIKPNASSLNANNTPPVPET